MILLLEFLLLLPFAIEVGCVCRFLLVVAICVLLEMVFMGWDKGPIPPSAKSFFMKFFESTGSWCYDLGSTVYEVGPT